MHLTEMELVFNIGLIGLFFVMGILFLLGKGKRFLTYSEYTPEEEIREKGRRAGILIEVACVCQVGTFLGRGYEIPWLSMISTMIMVVSLVGLVIVAGEAKEKKKKKK